MATAHEEPRPRGVRAGGGPWRALRRLSQRTPLRIKLITSLLALVAIALTVISFAGLAYLRSYLLQQYDDSLQSYGQSAIQNVREYLISGNTQPQNNTAVYWLTSSGKLQAVVTPATGVMGYQQSGPPLPGPDLSGIMPWLATHTQPVTVAAQSGGIRWRVVAFPHTFIDPQNGSEASGTIIVGVDVATVYSTLSKLTGIDLIVSAAVLFVLLIIGIAVVRANLIPLVEMEETAEEIAEGHLDRRVPEHDPRTEVGSLGRSLNIMLDQIQTAFRAREESEAAALQSEERMRRFIADASHELRTPLTAIRGFAEYYRQRGGIADRAAVDDEQPTTPSHEQVDFYVQPKYTNGTTASHPRAPDTSAPNDSATQGGRERSGQTEGLTPADLDRIMRRVESEAARMGVLVEDLLLLARLDQQRPLAHRPVDLLTLAADAVQDTRMLAPQRSVNLTVEPGAAFIVIGDEARLRQVIGNLMSNALTHTPEGTPVEVRISSGTLVPAPSGPPAARPNPVPAVVLAVADQGPGLTPEQTQRVFERFYRADQARTRKTGGSGLGLAIVSALVTAHGGTVSVQSTPGRGATFRIVLPLAPEAQGTDDPQDQDADPEPAPPPHHAQRS
jgi:two-component system, OmpR family, sensor kinase